MNTLKKYGVAILLGALGYILFWGAHTLYYDLTFLHQARIMAEAQAAHQSAPAAPEKK